MEEEVALEPIWEAGEPILYFMGFRMEWRDFRPLGPPMNHNTTKAKAVCMFGSIMLYNPFKSIQLGIGLTAITVEQFFFFVAR